MMVLESSRINNLYAGALTALKQYGEKKADGTIELVNVTTVLTDPRNRHITSTLLKHNVEYLKREALWYFMGTPDPAFVGEQAKLWLQVAGDDGRVNSNYGEYLFGSRFTGEFPGEMEYVLTELHKEDSRRAVAYIVTPQVYKQLNTTKDMPCTAVLQFFRRDNRLDLTVYMRSNDLIYGWRNDVAFFTLLQELVAANLGTSLGTYTHISGSLHIYPKHQWLLERIAEEKWDAEEVIFPKAVSADYAYFAYKDFVYFEPATPLQRFLVKPLQETRSASFILH